MLTRQRPAVKILLKRCRTGSGTVARRVVAVLMMLFAVVADRAEAADVAQWRFEELSWSGAAGEVVDGSGNGHDGTAVGGATTADTAPALVGNPGTCRYGSFSQAGEQHVTVAHDSTLNPSGSFALSMWVRVGGQPGTWRSPITSRWANAGATQRRGYNIYAGTDNRWQFWTGTGSGAYDIQTGPSVQIGTWTHLVFVFESSSVSGQVHIGRKYMYVNGMLVAVTNNALYRHNHTADLLIGAGFGFSPTFFFEGDIDELRVHDTVLNQGEVLALLAETHPCAAPTPVPTTVAEWQFEQSVWNGSAGEVVDESGNGHNGTANGGVTPTQTAPALAGDPGTCRYGQYAQAGSQMVQVPFDPALNPSGDFSVAMWVRVDGQQGTWRSPITSRWANAGATQRSGYNVYAGTDNRWQFWTGTGVGSYDIQTGPPVQVGVWTHVVVIFDSTSVSGQVHSGRKFMYIDGELVSIHGNATYRANQNEDLFIGAGFGFSPTFFFEGAIDEMRIYDAVLSESNVQTIMAETHPCPVQPPLPPAVAEWQFEQSAWTGASGEVIDTSGNGYHGTAVAGASTEQNTPALPGDPGTCRYGNYSQPATQRVEVPFDPGLNPAGDFAVAMWVRVNGSQGTWRSPLTSRWANPAATDRRGYNLYAGTDNRWQFWTGTGSGSYHIQTGPPVQVGAWTHLAVTYDSIFSFGPFHFGTKRMYIDGNLVATSIFARHRANDVADLYIGAGFGFSPTFFFDGNIDEVRIYDLVLSASEVQDVMNATHPCPNAVDHYAITHDGVVITCEAAAVTVTGHDNSAPAHLPVEPDTTITITTAPPSADIILKSGTPGNFVPGIGTAQYTFAPGETAVELWLRQLSPTLLNVDVVDASGVRESGGEDPLLDFRSAGFRFYADGIHNAIGTQIAGKSSTLPPGNQTLTLRAIQTNSDTGACEARLVPSPIDVDMAYRCIDPGACVLPNGAEINGTPIAGNPGAGVASYLPVSLDFGVNGTATFDLNYFDAGIIDLHARLTLPEAPPDPDPLVTLIGTSNAFVVKPAGLCVQAQQADSDCVSADTSCSRFRRAGDVFDLSVTAVAWQAAGEADTDFCTGNLTTQNFLLNAIALSSTRVAPASGGVDGVLARNAVDIVAQGAVAATDQAQSEVGVFTVLATPPAYHGELIAPARSANIGRFYPAYFDVIGNTPLLAASCGTFSYQDQPFYYATAPEVRLEARNTVGVPTVNYRDDFFRLTSTLPRTVSDNAMQAAILVNTVVDGTVTLSGESDLDAIATLALDAGVAGDVFEYQRQSEEGVFNADFDLEFTAAGFTDADGVCYDPEQDSTCNTLMLPAITGTELRFGRLALTSAFGSELMALGIPIKAEYFDGSTFVTNAADSCTVLTLASQILLSNPDTAAGAAQPGNSAMTVGASTSSVSSGDAMLIGGLSELLFSPPGSGNTGYIDITTDLAANLPWLLFDWDGGGTFDDNPTARASFGLFPGRKKLIYIREPWD